MGSAEVLSRVSPVMISCERVGFNENSFDVGVLAANCLFETFYSRLKFRGRESILELYFEIQQDLVRTHLHRQWIGCGHNVRVFLNDMTHRFDG